MEEYLGVAEDEGISQEEIGAAQAIVMAVSAGRVGAQLKAVAEARAAAGAQPRPDKEKERADGHER